MTVRLGNGVWVRTLVIGGALSLAGLSASANPVEQACIASGREAATGETCACIGIAANLTLSPDDQRQAASLFSDPQRAQDIRMSNRRRDEAFWQRYITFGQMAEDLCG